MKKILLTLGLVLSTLGLSAQSDEGRLTVYGQITCLDCVNLGANQVVANLDSRYKLSEYTTITNWSTITEGRTAAQGFDYGSSTTLLNFGREGTQTTISVGYTYLTVPTYEFDQSQFVVKLRFKIL
tara:strand:- start:296 stop:673 length:378 start_codon:yes stop_codon:yes gene_type:complete